MRLTLDRDFTSRAWPGPLAGGEAVVGEEWLGPRRLASLLVGALGLPSEVESSADRAARLVPVVTQLDGFWSASAQADALGSARRLLQWRDALALAGWNGEADQPRLVQLAQLSRSALPGLPDRLRWIAEAARKRESGVEELRLLTPRAEYEPLWRAVFDALEASGTRITEWSLAPAPAQGDLSAARSKGFVPKADGSLLLLRPPGPLQAAEEVAGWLASLPAEELRRTVIVGRDPMLDEALHRHGLPTLGAEYEVVDDAMLQLLPLVLELVWDPVDPQRAFELLLLHPTLVPGMSASELRGALREWPTVGSEDWDHVMGRALGAIGDAERREVVADRMRTLWTPECTRDREVPVEALERRVAMLVAWLEERLRVAEDEAVRGALQQCRTFRTLVARSGHVMFSEPRLRRFMGEAMRVAAVGRMYGACAGLVSVAAPGGIAGPVHNLVWWGFTGSGGAVERRPPLSAAELADLASRGVTFPSAEQAAAAAAARWQRPLLQTTHRLLLVSPHTDAAGAEVHPHPLWEEITARLEGNGPQRRAARAALEVASLEGFCKRSSRERLATPAAVRDWTIAPELIERRETESPSSVESLLGCPLQWTFRYVARLNGFDSPTVADAGSAQLLGDLMHELLDRLFDAGPLAPDAAAAAAERLFDEAAPRLAAPLWVPGAEGQRAQARRLLALTARRLADLMARTGTRIVASEESYGGYAFETDFKGRPDIVLGEPNRVLDLKWGSAAYRRDSLKLGTAFQLAAYAYLVSGQERFPGVAYFIINAQRLLTTAPDQFPGGEPIAGPSPEETWRLLQAEHATRWSLVEEGRLTATGVMPDGGEPPKKTQFKDGVWIFKPPCNHCDYSALCGKAFKQGGE